MRKYTYSISDNLVVCLTKYGGKTVKGIAKCDERFDEFNTDTGKKLSTARCNVKLRKKMLKLSASKLRNVEQELANLTRIVCNMRKRYNEDLEEYIAAKEFLKDFENSLE